MTWHPFDNHNTVPELLQVAAKWKESVLHAFCKPNTFCRQSNAQKTNVVYPRRAWPGIKAITILSHLILPPKYLLWSESLAVVTTVPCLIYWEVLILRQDLQDIVRPSCYAIKLDREQRRNMCGPHTVQVHSHYFCIQSEPCLTGLQQTLRFFFSPHCISNRQWKDVFLFTVHNNARYLFTRLHCREGTSFLHSSFSVLFLITISYRLTTPEASYTLSACICMRLSSSESTFVVPINRHVNLKCATTKKKHKKNI